MGQLPLARFLLWSALGTLAWSGVLLALGYVLQSRYEQIKDAIEWAARAVVGVMVALYLWRVARFQKDRRFPRGE